MRASALVVAVLLFSSEARAETLWSISAVEEVQHTAIGHGASLRGAYRYNDADSLGAMVQASVVPSDFRGGLAVAIRGALSLRHELAWAPGGGVVPFVGGALGAGFWTACVWPERCGGYGPLLGAEVGATYPISRALKLITSIQANAHSSWFAGEETISVVSWALGVEY